MVFILTVSQDLYYLAPTKANFETTNVMEPLYELWIKPPQGSLKFLYIVAECLSPKPASSSIKPGVVDRVSLGNPRLSFESGNILHDSFCMNEVESILLRVMYAQTLNIFN
jgi:hypothetical protein